MTSKRQIKLIKEGELVAEVEVDLLYDEGGWSPYLSLEDAYKLDDMRNALRKGDLGMASHFGRVFRLTPLAV